MVADFLHLLHIYTAKQKRRALQADAQQYSLKRYGQPNDVAHGVIYLLSDAASWVTGHSLVIDGGVTI